MFVAAGRNPNRFSLLLLEEGEYYFDDYEAAYYPTSASDQAAIQNKQVGRVKVCSKSILFAPDKSRYPILKFPFDNVVGCGKWNGSLLQLLEGKEVFVIRSEKRIEMKANDQNHPYNFVQSGKEEYRFSLGFETLINFLPKIQNLIRISQLHIQECQSQLSMLIEERESGILFNNTWLVNISEKTQIQLTANQLTPLVKTPGRIVVTDQRLYFQALNNVNPRPVDRYELSQIDRILTRRYALRQIGLEIFFKTGENLYLAFKDQRQRDQFYQRLLEQSVVPKPAPNDLELTTYKWKNRLISNFDYLMYLNSLAHRSFNDLTQYPVFPWVIADYTSSELDLNNPNSFRDLSKPIGALNPERLRSLKARFKEMAAIPEQTPFLYGTHYSAPGYVLYYLVRQAPEYMLRLQNGRFDTPNRIFHSIKETWQGVLENPSDVKELIPEFYMEEDFLLNTQELPLGTKANGEVVNDVILPPWAKSPKHFKEICRNALESDYVSANLHKWIDLIFGCNQRGEAAIQHDNVFYYITYEGAVDIEAINDPLERKSIEDQINEFGQTPHQLFVKPHPTRNPRGAAVETPPLNSSARNSPVPQRREIEVIHALPEIEEFPGAEPLSIADLPESSEYSTNSEQWPNLTKLKRNYSYKLHREKINCLSVSKDESTLYSVEQGGCLKIFDLEKTKQMRSITLCKLALSSCQLSSDEQMVISGSWDNNIYLYLTEYGRTESIRAHEDAVSCLRLQGDTLVSGSWDSTMKIWKLTPSSVQAVPSFGFIESDSEVRSIDLSFDANVCICGSADGKITVCDLRDIYSRTNLSVHSDGIHSIRFTPDARNMISSSLDGSIKLLDVSSGAELITLRAGRPVKCIATDGTKILAGVSGGVVQIWDIGSSSKIGELVDDEYPQADIDCLAISKHSLVTGSSDAVVCKWSQE